MATTWPVAAIAEFRGMKSASTFTDRTTGEVIPVPARAQFEVEGEDGAVAVIPVSTKELDRCVPPFDASSLKKGVMVELRGRVVLQDRGSQRDSFAIVESVSVAG